MYLTLKFSGIRESTLYQRESGFLSLKKGSARRESALNVLTIVLEDGSRSILASHEFLTFASEFGPKGELLPLYFQANPGDLLDGKLVYHKTILEHKWIC